MKASCALQEGWAPTWALVPRSNPASLLSQLLGDSAPPATDGHHSDLQQSCPDQHVCSGTVSLVPSPPPPPSAATSIPIPIVPKPYRPSCPMTPAALCSLSFLSPQPKCLLASSQILLFSLALIILPSWSPFQGLAEAGPEDYQPHGGEGQGRGASRGLFPRARKGWEGGPAAAA